MADDIIGDYSEEELEELEDKLLEEDFERRQEEMPVSGRSVFEIEKLKNRKASDSDKHESGGRSI